MGGVLAAGQVEFERLVEVAIAGALEVDAERVAAHDAVAMGGAPSDHVVVELSLRDPSRAEPLDRSAAETGQDLAASPFSLSPSAFDRLPRWNQR